MQYLLIRRGLRDTPCREFLDKVIPLDICFSLTPISRVHMKSMVLLWKVDNPYDTLAGGAALIVVDQLPLPPRRVGANTNHARSAQQVFSVEESHKPSTFAVASFASVYAEGGTFHWSSCCLLYTSPSPVSYTHLTLPTICSV